jgi:hypothetical protein
MSVSSAFPFTMAANVDGLLLCWNLLLIQTGTLADLKN